MWKQKDNNTLSVRPTLGLSGKSICTVRPQGCMVPHFTNGGMESARSIDDERETVISQTTGMYFALYSININNKSSLTVPQPVTQLGYISSLNSVTGLLCFYGSRQDVMDEKIVVLWNPSVGKAVSIISNSLLLRMDLLLLVLGFVPILVILSLLELILLAIRRSNLIISFDLKSHEFGEVCLPDSLVHTSGLVASKVYESLGLFNYYDDGTMRYRVLELRKNGEAIIENIADTNSSAIEVYEPSSGHINGKIPDNGIFKNRSATGLLGNPFLCFPKSNKTLCNYYPSKPSNRSHHVGVVTLATVLSSGLILGTILVVLRFRHFKRKNLRDSENAEVEYTPRVNIKRFYRKELEDATNNFSEVKNFNCREHSAQSAKSFQREMETLGKLRHINLLKVLGYAWESQRLQAVVLEYMEMRIDCLHTEYDSPIVHCDLKPSNILLADKWNAHVSDFGIARILRVDQHDGSSIFSTSAFVGTIGYLAPGNKYFRYFMVVYI
ncbi:LRR receptor-like serine/threonine-protein kinase FLS2 [Tanacetum coccineum]